MSYNKDRSLLALETFHAGLTAAENEYKADALRYRWYRDNIFMVSAAGRTTFFGPEDFEEYINLRMKEETK